MDGHMMFLKKWLFDLTSLIRVKYQIDNNILTFRSTNDVVIAKFKIK